MLEKHYPATNKMDVIDVYSWLEVGDCCRQFCGWEKATDC
jgi:hypothetical protein